MYPFHKKFPEDQISVTDPALRPVTVGSVITRFGYRILVGMNRLAVARTLLLLHQFSFGINGGVQQVILGFTLSLQLNPLFVEIDLDMANAHKFSSRNKTEEEIEGDIIFHYLLEVFRALYGTKITPNDITVTAPTAHPLVYICMSMVSAKVTVPRLFTSTYWLQEYV